MLLHHPHMCFFLLCQQHNMYIGCTFQSNVGKKYRQYYSKRKREFRQVLRNDRDEGLVICSKIKKRKLCYTILQRRGICIKNVHTNKMGDKYSILFQDQEVFLMFQRVAFVLGEPLWMLLRGWVQFQPQSIQRLFWRLKSNRYL